MAITVDTDSVQVVFPQHAEIYTILPALSVTAGAALYMNSAGLGTLTDAGTATTAKFDGIALEKTGANQANSLLKKGHVYGYDLSGMDYGATVYADVSGSLGTAAAAVSVPVGKVWGLADSNKTKVLYVDADWS